MLESELAARAAYRRTLNFVHRWECPPGVVVSFACFPQSCRVDVVVACTGASLDGINFKADTEREAGDILDVMAKYVLDRAREAYDDHEVHGKDGLVLDLALEMASRKFHEGLESAACRGKRRGG